jgi:hypothetical protein
MTEWIDARSSVYRAPPRPNEVSIVIARTLALVVFFTGTYAPWIPPAWADEPAPPASPAAAAPQPTPTVAVPQAAPAVSPVPAPTPEEIEHRRVTVDIESTRPSTVVERRVSFSESGGYYVFLPYRSTESTWEQVCVTPCRVDLDRYSTYRVGKVNGVVDSSSFTLPQVTDRFQLHIEPGSAIGHRIGIGATVVGLAAVIVGGGLLAAQHHFSDEQAARTAGFITGGAGIVVLGVGIPVAILTATKVLGPGGRVALTPRGLVF